MMGKIFYSALTFLTITTVVVGNHYENKSIDQAQQIASLEKVKQQIVYVDRIVLVPCDTLAYYRDGYRAGVEYGRNQNWHIADKNVTIVKQGHRVKYHYPGWTNKMVEGEGDVIYHDIQIK